MIGKKVRALLESDALAHISTVGAGGGPEVTIAWVGIEDDELVSATLFDQRKLRNVRSNPRVAISIQTDRTNEMGLREYLVIYGTARVTEGGAPELLQRLAHTYIGPDIVFPPMANPPPGYVTRVKIDRVTGVGPWKEG